MAATIASLSDGLRELLYKEVNNTQTIAAAGGAAGVQFAEDVIHTSGDVGTVALVVRKDTATAVAADGDYIPLIVDGSGRLWVHVATADALPLPSGAATSAQIGEVQASPTANTLLDRVKALLTGIVLASGANVIGKAGIDQTSPGSTNGVQIKQYAGVPSSFAIQTSDQTVFTLAAGEIGFIQNLHTTALAVKKGASASTTSLSLILPGGTAQDDGNGGPVIIDDWVGAVSVAAMSGSPRYVAWKQSAS